MCVFAMSKTHNQLWNAFIRAMYRNVTYVVLVINTINSIRFLVIRICWFDLLDLLKINLIYGVWISPIKQKSSNEVFRPFFNNLMWNIGNQLNLLALLDIIIILISMGYGIGFGDTLKMWNAAPSANVSLSHRRD